MTTCAILLPPANEVWGKVIFLVACVKNSVHRGEYLGRYTHPGRYPLGRYIPPLARHTPLSSVCQEFCSQGGVPGQVHPPRQVPPWQVHPRLARYTPWPDTPPDRYPQAGTPHRGRYAQPTSPPTPLSQEKCMLGDTGNKRAGHILLECILVS